MKKYIFIFFLIISVASNSFAASSGSINNSGNKIIVGIPYEDEVPSDAGQARIYEFSNGNWVQSGNNINGKASSDYFGNSTAMNASGNRFAVGAYANDGNGGNSGHVRIYENNNGTWTQIGSDI